MLRFSRLLRAAGAGADARMDTSTLTAAQLDQIRESVAGSSKGGSGETGGRVAVKKTWNWRADKPKAVVHYDRWSGIVLKRRKNPALPWIHLRDGTPTLWKERDPKINYEGKGFPNYPGDPLPSLYFGWRREFQKRRMQKNYWQKETAIQFAPFRRTLSNIAFNSQGILPKQLIEAGKSEFIGVSKGSAVWEGEHHGHNRFSSFKKTNPRRNREMCIMSGQIYGNLKRFRMHRMMWRTFADANKISGVTIARYGPPKNLENVNNPMRPRSYQHLWHDDLPIYD